MKVDRLLVLLSFVLAIVCGSSAFSAEVSQVIYIDFGPNDGVNGNNTSAADSGGNTWNNINRYLAADPTVGLVNESNIGTGYSLKMLTSMASNGIHNGALLNPSVSLLGDLAVNTATQDYFYTSERGQFSLIGLDTNKGYRFTFFASRDNAERRTSRYTVQGSSSHSYWLQTSGENIGVNVANSNDDQRITTEIYQPSNNGEVTITIDRAALSFAYINAIKIEVFDGMNFPTAQANVNNTCQSLDAHKIAVMGSSVAWGYFGGNPGGPFDHYISFDENRAGYPYHFSKLLDQSVNEDLKNSGVDRRWWVSNISIPGNNTTQILNRWDADLLPECAKYVIYGLSLANEGIMNDASAFDRFRNNLQLIIQKTRDAGMVPIVVNNYANNGYDNERYNRIIDMDMLIHQWDVPSVNALGTLDDLQGHFPSGYYQDGGHPNPAGYVEMYTALVPSLFSAMDSNKARPVKVQTRYVTLGEDTLLDFEPDGTLHSMTVAVDINAVNSGEVMKLRTQNGLAKLVINSSGRLEYLSENSNVSVSSSVVNNGVWHTIALTHYYAQGVTRLYVDGQHQGSDVFERVSVSKISLGGSASVSNLKARNLFSYRSAMNDREMAALNSGSLLQSSLELYAPLDGESNAEINLAQSTNSIDFVELTSEVMLFENCNYGGYSAGLHEGSYTLAQLNALGINNDDISSLRVKNGYQIEMYQHHNFTGTTITKNSDDACLVDDGYNDEISSVIISKVNNSWSTRIEAESFTNSSGIGVEACSEGGQNIGWLDAGDWIVWDVNLPSAGAYKVEYRVAGLNSTTIQLERAGGSPIYGQVQVPVTGDWQAWQTISHVVNLDAGQQQIAIYVPESGYNLNWIQFTKQ